MEPEMNRKKLVLTTLSCIFLLSGCAQMMSATEFLVRGKWTPRYTVEEAFAELQKQADEYTGSNVSKEKVAVLEPTNKKKNSCKIREEMDLDLVEGAKIYWDGRCKNGYAVGLGKVIIKNEHTQYEIIRDYSLDIKKGDKVKFFTRDYAKKQTLRGEATNTEATGETVWGIAEVIEDNSLENTARIHNVLGYTDKDISIKKAFLQKDDAYITIVERGAYRYIQIDANNPTINSPSQIKGIGLVADGPWENSLGAGYFARFAKYVINGKTVFVRSQNGKRELVEIWGDSYLLSQMEYELENAKNIISKFDPSTVTEVENTYISYLNSGKIKKPSKVPNEIYYQMATYYNDDLLKRIELTTQKDQLDLASKKQQINSEQLMLAQKRAIEKAQRDAASDAMLNSIISSGNQMVYRNMPTIQGYQAPSVTPMQPVGAAAVDVYRVQRINDNLYNVKQVR